MRTKSFLIISLLFPIITLIALTAYKKYLFESGYEVTLAVTGYDPRDLLSGHYVIYTVDYGVNGLCRDYATMQPGYICLDTKTFSQTRDVTCKHFIRGVCYAGRFDAGIEKFYIPENKAAMLDQKARDKQASILISVSPEGQAQVKDLLINGKSWREQ
jgi:uncharacterized membrane-anchored protein